MWQAVLIVILGLPLCFVSVLAPGFVARVDDERAWRGRESTRSYLRDWPWGWRRPEAMVEMEADQWRNGFVSQLRSSRGSAMVYSADFTADGAEAVTADGLQVSRWSLATGTLLAQYGERSRRAVEDARTMGHGFLSTGLLDGGRRVLALTNGPHSLQVFGTPPAAPILLSGDGYEGLATYGTRAAVVHSVQDRDEAVLVDMTTGKTTALPHPELTMLRFTPDGDLLTVSRQEARWWREGRLLRTAPMPGVAEPMGISTDFRRVLLPEGNSIVVWNLERMDSEKRFYHSGDMMAACANAEYLLMGSREGTILRWSFATGYLEAPTWAHPGSVDRLFCGPHHVISMHSGGGDTRLWRADGKPVGTAPAKAPEQSPGWLVEQGLAVAWPDFVRDYEDSFRVGGWVGMGVVVMAAYWRARRKPAS
jgi:hypothetical protein